MTGESKGGVEEVRAKCHTSREKVKVRTGARRERRRTNKLNESLPSNSGEGTPPEGTRGGCCPGTSGFGTSTTSVWTRGNTTAVVVDGPTWDTGWSRPGADGPVRVAVQRPGSVVDRVSFVRH